MSFALAAFLLVATPKGTGPTWDAVVQLEDMGRGQANVTLTFRGFSGTLRLCADLEESAGRVHELRQTSGGTTRTLERAPGEEACWNASASDPAGAVVHYRFDLAGLADEAHDPDRVLRTGDGFVLTEQALLLRPDPLPAGAPISVQFQLPPGNAASTPWDVVAGKGDAYATTSTQFDAGSYLALGKVHALEALTFPSGKVALAVVEGPHRASEAGLRRWVERAARAVADFYGGTPGSRMEVLLVPVPHTRASGVFGSVLHRGLPSAVLFFGAEAPDAAFDEDWVATHELFHAGVPFVEGRPSWFVEGVATYYQDVLRGRSGTRTASAMWADLADGFQRFCDPVGARTLEEESRRMHSAHSYRRVYWGGACVLFHLDVQIRRKSGGRRSLDSVLTAWHQRPPGDLTEAEVRAALDAEAGPGAVERLLETRAPLRTRALLEELGVEPLTDEEARLRDGAPLSQLRKGIF